MRRTPRTGVTPNRIYVDHGLTGSNRVLWCVTAACRSMSNANVDFRSQAGPPR